MHKLSAWNTRTPDPVKALMIQALKETLPLLDYARVPTLVKNADVVATQVREALKQAEQM